MHTLQAITSIKIGKAKIVSSCVLTSATGIVILIVYCCHIVDEHARALEEQWIDSFDGGNAPLSQSSSGASSTILHGIVLGFFFPIIPFFFFRLSKPAVFWDDGTEHDALGASVFS